jgi:hypothetical protein
MVSSFMAFILRLLQPLSESQNTADSTVAMLFGDNSHDDDSILGDDDLSVHGTSGGAAAADVTIAWMMAAEGNSEVSVHAVSEAVAVADAAMEALMMDANSKEGSPPPAPPTGVDVVMRLLNEKTDSDEDSQPGLCFFPVY